MDGSDTLSSYPGFPYSISILSHYQNNCQKWSFWLLLLVSWLCRYSTSEKNRKTYKFSGESIGNLTSINSSETPLTSHTKYCNLSQKEKFLCFSRTVVLKLWVMTPWGSHIRLWFITVSKLQLWRSNEIMLWLGVSITRGTVLKGHSIRKVENHWSRMRQKFPCCSK